VANLADWPRIGCERNDIRIGLRSIASPPHVIFYRLREGRAEIVRVLHGHRDIGRILADETET
jgi:toxin ParE1/3/4